MVFSPPYFLNRRLMWRSPPFRTTCDQCCLVWRAARAALLHSTAQNQRLADRHRSPAPAYTPGQKVWLSSKDLPLQTDSKKLAPRYIYPFDIVRMINPAVTHLKLPASLKVHPSFHVSLLKPVSSSPFNPGLPTALAPDYPVTNGDHSVLTSLVFYDYTFCVFCLPH